MNKKCLLLVRQKQKPYTVKYRFKFGVNESQTEYIMNKRNNFYENQRYNIKPQKQKTKKGIKNKYLSPTNFTPLPSKVINKKISYKCAEKKKLDKR